MPYRDPLRRRGNNAVTSRRYRARYPRRAFAALIAYDYGLTLEQFDAMVVRQEGRCAVCSEPLGRKRGKRDNTNIDHCHREGRVRGLLCTTCNLGMSHIDRAGWLEPALRYHRQNQKAIT